VPLVRSKGLTGVQTTQLILYAQTLQIEAKEDEMI